MSFWDESFFNYSVPDLNEEPLAEYSYGTIDLNAEPNADVGFDSQASYGFVYDDMEFLSTFRYRAHQAAIRVKEDAELPPDIEFSLGGQHFEMSIERAGDRPQRLRTGVDAGGGGGDEGLVGPDIIYAVHWPQGTVDDDQRSSDPLHPLLHRDYHLRSRPVTMTDLFYLYSLIARRPCNLARCFALYHASFHHRQERGTLLGGAFITHIARTRGMVDMLDDLAAIEPRKLDRRTIISMKLAADIPGLGLRFIGQDGRPFQLAQ
ncbi:hypothetical protein R6Q57_004335, partial [Mikania cordata]